MDLTLSDEQRMLSAAAADFVERGRPFATGFDGDRWRAMASLGWAGLALGDDVGGAGGSLLDLAVLCEALGHGPVPSPLVTTAVAALVLDAAGTDEQRARWLPAIAAGSAVATLAVVEPGAGDEWSPPSMPGGPSLSGTKLLVPWAADAAAVVVATAGGLHVVEPGTGGVTVERHDDLDADPLYAVTFDGAPAERLGGAGDHAEVLARALDVGAALSLAFAVGAAERALALSVTHATDRHQFGRPIGAFQAVAHRCVDVRTDVDACRYLAYRAAWALARGGDAALEVASAKAWGNDALRRIARNAHQVHGAIGFSTEHELHRTTRVAKATELTFGATARHLDRVADAMGLRR